MRLDVIEDCSPYYVRFTIDRLKDAVDYVRSVTPEKITEHLGYTHEFLGQVQALQLFSLLPISKRINFKRASVFSTPPQGGCGIHKDGIDHRTSFNIILDGTDECVTTWYADELFEGLDTRTLGGYTRNVVQDWNTLDQYTPLKSFIAKEGEMVLFNTDIYHAWSNKSTSVTRRNLLMRSATPGLLDFYQMKKLLGI